MPTSNISHRSGLFRALGAALLVVAAAVATAPRQAEAHAAGALDPHGCHTDNRKNHDYHCHRGAYSGISFTSKYDMIEKKKAGVTAEELRAPDPNAEPPAPEEANEDPHSKDGSWTLFGWKEKKPDTVAGVDGGAIVPKGVESRLRTLKGLHSEGLISDEEYAQKKAEILGDL